MVPTMRMWSVTRAAVVSITLVAVACGPSTSPGGGAIAPLPAIPSASPEPGADTAGATDTVPARRSPRRVVARGARVDVSVVPGAVTEPYVDAVLVELERLLFEALLTLRAEQELTLEVTDRIGSASDERHYQLRLREFVGLVEDDFAGLREAHELRPRVRDVVALLDVTPDCIYAETITDSSGVARDTSGGQVSFVVLRLADDSRHVDLNPTPWVYAQIGIGDPDALRGHRPC